MKKKTLFHSFMFLLSRALILVTLSPLRVFLWAKHIIWNVAAICSAQQIVTCVFLYFKSRVVSNRIRFQKFVIVGSNGVLGKVTAAILVYLEYFIDEPHYINLFHWIEVALQRSIYVECEKLYYALFGELEYTIENSYTICYRPVNIDLHSRFREKHKILQERASKVLEHVLNFQKDDVRHYMCRSIFRVYPSITCALCTILNDRKNVSRFGSEIREYSYQRYSISMNDLRKWRKNNGRKNTRAVMFGEDVTDQFRKGTSRKIAVKSDNDDDIKSVILDIFSANPLAAAGNEEIIDQDAVYAISYRHCKNNPDKEVFAFLLAIRCAKQLAIKTKKSEYRIWCDKILNISPGERKNNLWSSEGLLMYSYYRTIAIRNMETDEEYRMWLLAEERLAYGSPGLLNINYEDQNISWKRTSEDAGPENSIRMYLRFLKTGEGLKEKTYHIADKENFKRLSTHFGYVDDELEMIKGLNMQNISRRKTMGEMEKSIWWPQVIDVETYASLRSIEYEKKLTVVHNSGKGYQFCGFREWFKNNVDLLAVNETLPAFKAYLFKKMHIKNIVLIIKERSGTVHGVGILMIEVKDINQFYVAERTFRIYLEYNDNNVPEKSDVLNKIAEKEYINYEDIRECDECFLVRHPCQCMMLKTDGTTFQEPQTKDRITSSVFMHSAICTECECKFTFFQIN